MTTSPPRPAVSDRLQALIDQLPPVLVDRAAALLRRHLEHGGLSVRMPDTWCACGENLGPALVVKAGEMRLHNLIDEVIAARPATRPDLRLV